MSQEALTRIAEKTVKNRLERIEGVGSAEIQGEVTREVHVDVDHKKLAAYNLTLADVNRALRNDNLTKEAGGSKTDGPNT